MMHQRRLCVHGDKCRPLSLKQLLNCKILHNVDPKITIEVVADHCAIKLSRLRKYIADSEPDQISFLALLRIADFLDAWDLVDFALQQYRRRTAPLDTPESSSNPLNEAVDVSVRVGELLSEVRSAVASDGVDPTECARIQELTRLIRRECDDVDAAAVAATKAGAR